MRIAGIQKLTLLDFPEHIAATIFTPGCDFRCPFCHNSELVLDNSETEYYVDEVIEFLQQRIGRLNGVAITGGEPLMQSGIKDFIKTLREIGFKIKLDTNGSYPEKLKELLDEGLVDYVAMDIKNSPGEWAKTAGLSGEAAEILFKKSCESMQILKSSGIDFEFRTTVVKGLHTKKSIEEMAEFIGPVDKYFLQNFEDSGAILEDGYSGFSKEEMHEFLDAVKKHIPNAKLRGVD